MIDSIVVFPLDSMELELGLNVIGFQKPALFYTFIEGLRGATEDVVLGEGSGVAAVAKKVLFVGDCASGLDYDSLYQKMAIKKVLDDFNPEQLSRVLALQSEMKMILQDEIWRDDLPLDITSSLDLKAVVTMAKLRVDVSSLGSLFDRIQLLVDTAGALAESRMLVTLHTTQYCDNDQLLYLHRELSRHKMQLLDLECCDKRIDLAEGRSYYVDADFVQFS